MKSLNAPRWNLDSIFPSIKSPEYKNYVVDFQKLLSEAENHISKFIDSYHSERNEESLNENFSSWLKTSIKLFEKLAEFSRTLNSYAYLIYSVDTTNTEYLNNITFIQNLLIQKDQISLKFQATLKNNSSKLPKFFDDFPKFKKYEYLLNEEIDQTRHQMPAELEKLASELQQTGGNAWEKLHEQIISNLKDDETGKTFNELRNDAFSPNPKIRFESYKKEIELLKQNEIAIAASLNNLKGETLTLNKRRDFAGDDGFLLRSLSSSRLSKKSLDALISAIEKSLPDWRRYFQAKAKYLKNHKLTVSKDNSKGLAFYDLFAPLSEPSNGRHSEQASRHSERSEESQTSLLSKTWTFDEAIQYVIQKYYSFSREMGDFATNAYKNHWIDAEIRPGKVGGAYDEDIPKGHQSRVMSNFTGAFSDVITLAHELGHAYHFSCMKNKSPLFYDYPMTLAETASTFAETIVKQDIISKSSGFDKLVALELDLQDASQTLVDILSRFYFERSVFQNRKTGELSAKDFCALMLKAQNDSYSEGLGTEKHEYMWAVKSHYYSTGFDFYNYPYAFGQLFSMALYRQYKEKGSFFTKIYPEILSQTGNMSCEDLCKIAGLDIQDEKTWSDAISVYTKEIDEFEKLAE